MYSISILINLVVGSISLAAFYLIGALGGLYTQKAGILNLCLNGFMVCGAFGGFIIAFYTNNAWLGALGGIVAGAIISSFFAFICITLGTNQSISSLALNITVTALEIFFYRIIFGISTTLPILKNSFKEIHIPVLSDIAYVGPIIFSHYIFVYFALFMLIVMDIFLNKTKTGIKIIASGENPNAAFTRGINVPRVRYFCTIFGGALAGLAGSFLSIAKFNQYIPGIVAGRGYIAFALIIFGRWKPYTIMWGALLFGFLESLSFTLQTLSIFPHQFFLMLPYLFTIMALVMTAKKQRSERPAFMAIPFKRPDEA